MTQVDFSDRILMSQTHLSSIEMGRKEITELTIRLIYNEFDINEEWLRTGEGDMFLQSFEVELSEILGELLVTDSERTKDILIEICKLEDHESELILELLKTINKNK